MTTPTAPMNPENRDRDTGAALMTVVMVLALFSALTLTLVSMATQNLGAARLQQQAGAAANASDAGITQGLTYLRQTGTKALNKCQSSPTTCAEPYGNPTNPAVVTIPGRAGQQYKVWIEVLSPYLNTQTSVGRYRIHATGTAGGPAAREVTADALVSAHKIPMGIMAKQIIGGGNTDVHRESVFSTGCIWKRSKIAFDGIDAYYGIPAAAHSSQIITDEIGTGQYCNGTRRAIHDPALPAPGRYCNTAFPYDEDKYGGPLYGTTCYQKYSPTYPLNSLLANDNQLLARYDVKRPPFTQAQLDNLKAIAVSQGNYWTTSNANLWTSPTEKDAIIYFDLTATDPGGLVDLNFMTGWSRPTPILATDPACEERSLLIIIEGGDAKLNSNGNLFASLFVISEDPYGTLQKANGNTTFTGSIYANAIDFTGTADTYLDECFLANTHPGLTSVELFNYREADR